MAGPSRSKASRIATVLRRDIVGGMDITSLIINVVLIAVTLLVIWYARQTVGEGKKATDAALDTRRGGEGPAEGCAGNGDILGCSAGGARLRSQPQVSPHAADIGRGQLTPGTRPGLQTD
jgi:hypothetical protein